MSESLHNPNDDELDLDGFDLDGDDELNGDSPEDVDSSLEDLSLDGEETDQEEKPDEEVLSEPNDGTPDKKQAKVVSTRTQKKHEERLLLQDFILKPMSELEDRASAIRKAAAEAAAIEEARKRLEAQQKKDAEKKESEKQSELDVEAEEATPDKRWLPISDTVSSEGLEKINSIFDEPLLKSALKEDGSLNFDSLGNDSENKVRRTFRTLMGFTPTWKLLEQEDMIHGRPALKRLGVLCLSPSSTEAEKEKAAHLNSFFEMHENTQSRDGLTFECGFSASYTGENTQVIVTDTHTLIKSTSSQNDSHSIYSGFPFSTAYLVVEGGRNMLCAALHEESRLLTKEEISNRADERIQNFTNLPKEELIAQATSLRSKSFASDTEEAVVSNAEAMIANEARTNMTSDVIPKLLVCSPRPEPEATQRYHSEREISSIITSIKEGFDIKGKSKLTREGFDTFFQKEGMSIKLNTQKTVFGYSVSPLSISLEHGPDLSFKRIGNVYTRDLVIATKAMAQIDPRTGVLVEEDENTLTQMLLSLNSVASNMLVNGEEFVFDRNRLSPPVETQPTHNRMDSPEI